MKLFVKTALLLIIVSLLSACKTISVYPFSDLDPEKSENGIVYQLPMQILKIEIDVEKVEHFEGVFAPFASKYFGHKTVASNNKKYDIIGVRLASYSIADPDLKFWIELDDDRIDKNQNLKVKKSADGILQWMKLEENEKKSKKQKVIERKIEKEIINNDLENGSSLNVVSERIFYSAINDENAKQLFDQLTEIRAQKTRILTGYQEIAYAPQTIQFMYHQLHAQEEEILKLFFGSSRSSISTESFEFKPVRNQREGSFILCRFSENEGVRGVSETSYAPVILQYKAGQVQKPVFVEEKNESKGIHYIIPANADFTIKLFDDILLSRNILISQYGYTGYLPTSVKEVKLDSKTGSLKYVQYSP